MSRVYGAGQHRVTEMKSWAPNDILDGKKLIRDFREKCKRKDKFEPALMSKDFNLKQIGAPLLKLFDVDSSEYVHVEATLYSSCPFKKITDLFSRLLIKLCYIHHGLDYVPSSRTTRVYMKRHNGSDRQTESR